MAQNSLQLHNDLWLLAEEIQERLENARTSTKALLILKERALVEAACGDVLEAFQHIAGEATQAASRVCDPAPVSDLLFLRSIGYIGYWMPR